MRTAIYAFSGDPITYGHIDIIKRTARVFERVVVGIGINPDKKYTFTLEEREDMAKKVLYFLPNVEVAAFQGLLVDYAKEHDIPVIVKGVRDSNDFQYEALLYNVGESQKLNIDTFFIPAKNELAHVSSSAVKALQKEQGLVHDYVPLYVKQLLEERLSGQYIIGVSGEIGAGKTYMSEQLAQLGRNAGIPVYHLDVDAIGHQVLSELTEPLYVQTRQELARQFGSDVLSSDGFVKKKILGEIVFSNDSVLQTMNQILYEPMLLRLRREMYGKKGLILVNAALLVEARWAYLCNNNVILIHCDKKSQMRRLEKRELSDERKERRMKSQYSFSKKRELLIEKIKKDGQGEVLILENSDGTHAQEIRKIFEQCLVLLRIRR